MSDREGGPPAPPAKVFVLLRRKAGTGRVDFSRYWAERHGPLVAGRPEFWRYTAHYVQNHLLGTGGEPFDGVAISTQGRGRGEAGGFPDEPCYAEIIRPDERRFMDPAAIVRFLTHGHVLIDGAATSRKLLLFADAALLSAVERARPGPETGIRRLIVNRCVEGTVRAAVLAPQLPAFDGVIELWRGDDDETDPPMTIAGGAARAYTVRVREMEMSPP